MARKVCHVILIISIQLLVSAHLGAAAPNSVTNFPDYINAQMNHSTQNLNRQIENMNRQIENMNRQIENSVQQALAQVNKTLKDLPRDEHGRLITTGGSTVSINTGSRNSTSVSYTINSGYTTNGVSYKNITEVNDGKYLYHDETFYNSTSNATERIRWRLNLTKPGAELEYLPNE